MNYSARQIKNLAKTARGLRDIYAMNDMTKNERIEAKRAAACKARDYAEMVAYTHGIDTSAVVAEMREIIAEADDEEAFRGECFGATWAPAKKKTGWEAEITVMVASH